MSMKNNLLNIFNDIYYNIRYFCKWVVFALVCGLLGGIVGASFVKLIVYATELRTDYRIFVLGLPLAGSAIVFLYSRFLKNGNKGTNLILESVSEGAVIDKAVGPLIYISTVLTHLTGGSAGREGAALQIGGSIGTAVGNIFGLDEKDMKIGVMCGMSAMFAAVFGTPIAAAIFPIEVISIGILHFSALLPCLFSSFIGYEISMMFGTGFEQFVIAEIPVFSLKTALYIILLGILCGILAQFFCLILHSSEKIYKKLTKSPYIRIIISSAILISLTYILKTDMFLGTSSIILEEAFYGELPWYTFIMKLIFTAVTLGAGFKGGEIVPTFCVGAAFGALFGKLTGMPYALCAACGMSALFVGVTNCPITTLIIALEMLSKDAMPYYSLVIAVSFCFSGYSSLYSSQRIMYSKRRTEFINNIYS